LVSALPNGRFQSEAYLEFQRQIEIFHLADENRRLTDYGWMKAVECLPLTEQCKYLSIPLDSIQLKKQNAQVEVDALKFHEKLGWTGVACEGYLFLALLKSLSLTAILQMKREQGETLPTAVIEKNLLEADVIDPKNPDSVSKEARKAVLDSTQNSHTSDIVRNFKRFYAKSMYSAKCPHMTPDLLTSFYSALTPGHFVGLAEFFLENPYGHRNGWPDITLIKGKTIKLIEVKTNDKLRCAQIRAFPRIRAYIPDILVLQVKRIP